MATTTYRLPLFGAPDPLLQRGLRIAGGIGLVVLALGLLFPKRAAQIDDVEQMPERFAKLILTEPTPPPVQIAAKASAVIEAPPAPEPAPEPIAAPPPRAESAPRRPPSAPVIPEDRGTAGRERARKEVTQQLASTASSIDGMLAGLDAALQKSGDAPAAPRAPRRRGTRAGRSAAQLGAVGALPAGTASFGESAAIGGARIEIAAIGGVESAGGGSSSGPAASGAGGAPGASGRDLRSDASLLAVVRKYAPGIRFCYENELKKNPALGGKLVVAITVAAAGHVSGAVIVQDTLGARELTSCALAQIEAWRFPTIPDGSVTFRAPFVFTPPE
jgi:TonB family protein